MYPSYGYVDDLFDHIFSFKMKKKMLQIAKYTPMCEHDTMRYKDHDNREAKGGSKIRINRSKVIMPGGWGKGQYPIYSETKEICHHNIDQYCSKKEE